MKWSVKNRNKSLHPLFAPFSVSVPPDADGNGHPTRGMGIDLYWAADEFDVLGPSVEIPFFGHINNVYRYIGTLKFDYTNFLDSGTIQVKQDYRLIARRLPEHQTRLQIHKKYFKDFLKKNNVSI